MVKILRGPRVYYAAGIRTECENCCGKGKFEGRACFYCGGSKKIPQFCPICGEPAVQIEHRGPEVGKGWYVYLCEEHRTKVFEPTKPESTGIINDLVSIGSLPPVFRCRAPALPIGSVHGSTTQCHGYSLSFAVDPG